MPLFHIAESKLQRLGAPVSSQVELWNLPEVMTKKGVYGLLFLFVFFRYHFGVYCQSGYFVFLTANCKQTVKGNAKQTHTHRSVTDWF